MHLPERMAEIRAIRELHARDVDEIRALLSGKGAPEEEHMVSREELKFLMTSDDEESE